MLDGRLKSLRRRIHAAEDKLIVLHHVAHDFVRVHRNRPFFAGHAGKNENRIRPQMFHHFEGQAGRASGLVDHVNGPSQLRQLLGGMRLGRNVLRADRAQIWFFSSWFGERE